MIPAAKLANPDQIATAVVSIVADGAAAGSRAVDIRVWDGIDLRLLPDRGLDIGAAWFRGTPARVDLARRRAGAAAARGARRQRVVRDAWGGGLVTTCGLSNVGAPSEGYGLHGTYTARPATDLQIERTTSEVTVTGTIVDPPFTLSRRIVTTRRPGARPHRRPRRQRLRVDGCRAPALPRQHRRSDVGRGRRPRDRCARGRPARRRPPRPTSRPGTSRRARRDGAAERVFEHVGATWARLTSPAPRHRADGSLVAAAALAVGTPGERDSTRSGSSPPTARCSAASTTSRRAGCRSSTRVRHGTSWLTIAAGRS